MWLVAWVLCAFVKHWVLNKEARPVAYEASKCLFSNSASVARQDSAAPPSAGVCTAWQLILISAAWHRKHALCGIELVLFFTPDAFNWPIRTRAGGSYSSLMSKHQNSLITEDVNLKLIQLQTVLLLLAFSTLLNITASTSAAKHQIMVLMGGLLWNSARWTAVCLCC